jgi:hypothetical protein
MASVCGHPGAPSRGEPLGSLDQDPEGRGAVLALTSSGAGGYDGVIAD